MIYNRDELNIRFDAPTLQPWTGDPDKTVAVLMSGGVDSSVTALLLKQAGWDVVGITMKIPLAKECDIKRSCCGIEAAQVCKQLGIPHYFMYIQDAFDKLVIEPFREAYRLGRTPSPCVDCNTVFKFGLVWDMIEEEFGIKNLATGHYARIVREEGKTYLARGGDKNKDQSYFLYGIPRHRLEHFHLPVGELSKDETRKLARVAELPVAWRPESMELCFVGEGDYRDALASDVTSSGPILDMSGKVIGQHEGIINYTVGQRKGLQVTLGQPAYVVRISVKDNSVTVGIREDACSSDITAEEVNVLVPEKFRVGETLFGKIRSRGEPTTCELIAIVDDTVAVRFTKPQFAPTPGQRLVLFDSHDNVVAGGVIR